MSLEHDQILKLLESLGYDFNKTGMCAGITAMGMMAIFSKDLVKFDLRTNFLAEQLAKLSIGDLASKINSVQEKRVAKIEVYRKELLIQLGKDPLMKDKEFYKLLKIKELKKHPSLIAFNKKCDNVDSVLNEDELALSDVHAFLEGIVISFYCSGFYPELYKKKHRVKYQDLEITLQYILSHKLVKKPNLKSRNPFKKLMKSRLKEKPLVKKVGLIVGMYDSNELQTFFGELLKISNRIYPPIVYQLGSANHAITVFYNNEKGCWQLIDANNLPTKKFYTAAGLVDAIFSSFNVVDKLVLETEVYCMKEILKPVKKELADLEKNPTWQELHAVEGKQTAVDDLDFTLLRMAARTGDVNLLGSLLKCKNPAVEINKIALGKTPLAAAILNGKTEAAKLILKNKFHQVDPNILYVGLYSPLSLAVENGNIEIIKLLLKMTNPKVNVDLVGEGAFSPLQLAASMGELAILNLLLKAEADIDGPTSSGDTAMHLAIDKGHLNVVEALLEDKANLHVTAQDGDTPLLRAIRKRNLPIVKAILNSKHHWVDPMEKTNDGISALSKAAEVGDIEVLKELLLCKGMDKRNVEGTELLSLAAKNGHANMVLFLLNNQSIVFTVKNRTIAASSAFYIAVVNKHLNVVQALLKLNDRTINPNIASNDNGYTPFLKAVIAKNILMISALLECKNPQVDINKPDNNGFTALYYAVEYGDADVVKLLLDSKDHNIDPYLTVDGYSPLCLAAYNKNIEIFNIILSHTNFLMDPVLAYENVKEAVFTAASYGCLDIINAALSSKLFLNDIEKANKHAELMRVTAAQNGHAEVANVLRQFVQNNKKMIQKNRSVNVEKENRSPTNQQNKKSRISPSSVNKNVFNKSKRSNSSPLRNNSVFLNRNSVVNSPIIEPLLEAQTTPPKRNRGPDKKLESENVHSAKRRCGVRV